MSKTHTKTTLTNGLTVLLKEIHRVLFPHGRLIVNFPDHNDPAVWAIKTTEQEDGVSFFIYEDSSIRSIIAESAFRIVTTVKADCESLYLLAPLVD